MGGEPGGGAMGSGGGSGGGDGAKRLPQSSQSFPVEQTLNSAPGPPSSQKPSFTHPGMGQELSQTMGGSGGGGGLGGGALGLGGG